jgi:hypothetical protein
MRPYLMGVTYISEPYYMGLRSDIRSHKYAHDPYIFI